MDAVRNKIDDGGDAEIKEQSETPSHFKQLKAVVIQCSYPSESYHGSTLLPSSLSS
jgi:hypothetical protein